jgi:hypothetical protein
LPLKPINFTGMMCFCKGFVWKMLFGITLDYLYVYWWLPQR